MSALPIVLLHGAGADGNAWDAWRPLLAPRVVITPSLPGRGDVAGPAPTSVADAARFVAASVTAPRFVVAGHSYGGAIALELALGWPERVAGLALIATGARLRVHPSILDGLARGLDPARGFAPWDATSPVPIESALADWRAANAFDRLATPLDVRCPTVVIVGTADLLTPPKYARWLVANIPGAQLAELDGETHDVPHVRPDCVAPLVGSLS